LLVRTLSEHKNETFVVERFSLLSTSICLYNKIVEVVCFLFKKG